MFLSAQPIVSQFGAYHFPRGQTRTQPDPTTNGANREKTRLKKPHPPARAQHVTRKNKAATAIVSESGRKKKPGRPSVIVPPPSAAAADLANQLRRAFLRAPLVCLHTFTHALSPLSPSLPFGRVVLTFSAFGSSASRWRCESVSLPLPLSLSAAMDEKEERSRAPERRRAARRRRGLEFGRTADIGEGET